MEDDEEEKGQEIWSWGAGTDGQLGTCKLQDDHFPQLLHLPSAPCFSMLACGGAHVIALTSAGKVLTWGRGTSGQLGLGDTVNNPLPMPVNFSESCFITHVSAGWNHSGFVSDGGSVFTCGDGSFGQLGHGDFKSRCSPVKISYFGDRHVEQIACGMRHSIVLLKGHSGDQVYAFGSGKRGQLGVSKGRVKSVGLPEVTCGLEYVEIKGIAANGDQSAALSTNGHLYTWGKGYNGTMNAFSPTHVPASLFFTEVALGWNHALLLTGDGEAIMLGGNNHGVLSNPDKKSSVKNLQGSIRVHLERVPALEGKKAVHIAAGAEHSALVTEDKVIKTWGWGEHGQLGLGNTCDQIRPESVSLGQDVHKEAAEIKVYCGSGFTIAVRSLL